MKKNWVPITKLLIFAVCALFFAGIIAGCSNDTGGNNSDEETTATLMGNVKDASTEAYLMGVTLTAGGVKAISDVNGNYILSSIKPGKYTLTATMTGYQDYTHEVTLLEGINNLDFMITPLEQ